MYHTPPPPPPPHTHSVKLWLVRLLTNTLVLVCLAGTSYAIFLAVENAENTNADTQRNFQAAIDGGWQGIWSLLLSFQASTEHHINCVSC